MAEVKKYYLSNETFGFSPDSCLFDSREDAIKALKQIVRVSDADEHERVLSLCMQFNGSSAFHEIWSITEVFDWPTRRFGSRKYYVLIRTPDEAVLSDDGSFDIPLARACF